MTVHASKGVRLVALGLLKSVLEEGQNLGEFEPDDRQIEARDRAFAYHLAYGVLRWLTALEWLAGQLLQRPLRRKDRDVHRLILLGLFQLWKDKSAPHAAINECAEGARKLGKPWAVAVINAVLRRFQREQNDWLGQLEQHDERFAHPGWLLSALKKDWPGHWQAIAEANNQPGPLWLRLNQSMNIADTLQQIENEGFKLTRHPAACHAVKIEPPATVTTLAAFNEGRVSVQDPAAQLAAELLDVQDHHRVLDACAAPGGKSCHMLERAPNATLTVLEQSPSRLERVTENMDRLGIKSRENIQLIAADASEPETWWDGVPFSRILLDAPCSATGVIRRHPEIKWLRSQGQVEKAAEQQARLLRRLWPLLEAGGMLLYATCSVLKAENTKQIQQFVKQHPDAELVVIDSRWGRNSDFGRQILPGELEMDGFFYARLRKNS
jgi:16S rRNA (cytosine967-C5)-methyltransferase